MLQVRVVSLVLAHVEKTIPEIRDDPIDDDVVYEIDAAGSLTGFEWHAADHFDEFGFDDAAKEAIRTCYPGTRFEWLHGNSPSYVGANPWYEAGYDAFHPDNFIYSSREANFVIIISRETDEIVWRLGPDFAGRPEEAIGQFVGQHHAHMIPRGLPGEGNVLVFDNGGGSGYVHTPDSSGNRADWLYRAYRVPPEWLPAGQNEAFGNYPTWASLFE